MSVGAKVSSVFRRLGRSSRRTSKRRRTERRLRRRESRSSLTRTKRTDLSLSKFKFAAAVSLLVRLFRKCVRKRWSS